MSFRSLIRLNLLIKLAFNQFVVTSFNLVFNEFKYMSISLESCTYIFISI